MKNVKFAIFAIFVASAAIAGYSAYTCQKTSSMSNLTLANVEALAGGESGKNTYCCAPYSIVCYKILGGGNVMGLELPRPCN